MRISSIQAVSNSYFIDNKYKKNKNNNSVNYTNNTILPDNYGSSLVNFKSQLKNKVLKAPLYDKLAYAFDKMTTTDLLIASNNKQKALEQLQKNIEAVETPIKRILHIEDKNLDEVLCYIQPNDDVIGKRFVNINDSVIKYSKFVFTNKADTVIDIEPREAKNLYFGNELHTSIGIIPLLLVPETLTTEDFDKYSEELITEIDYTEQFTEMAKDYNKKLFAKEQTKTQNNGKNFTTFKDIGGQDEILEFLEDNIVLPLQHPDVFEDYMNCTGLILHGKPGTGKTYIANAIINEAGVSSYILSPGQLADKYVGGSEKLCKEMFEKAIATQPSIIYIDEIDALGKSRGRDVHGDKLLNEFLIYSGQLNQNNDNVIIIGSTNRLQDVDPAVLRSGRLDLQLEIKPPTLDGIKQILDIKLKGKPIDEDVNMDLVAKKMFAKNMTGADINRIIRDSHRNALKRTGILQSMKEKRYSPAMMEYFTINQEDFEKSIEAFNPDNNARKPIGFSKV